MSDLPSPQAEAAYRRALSAYQKGSYDEAQRWATEALSTEPAHAAAAALLRRLGGREAGPRVVSTDPSLLVTGNGGYGMAEPADPTIVVPRRAPRPAPPKRRPVSTSPRESSARRASEPTVIVPSNGGSHSWGNASYDRPNSSLWRRLWGGGSGRDGVGAATSRARGILIVAGAVAFAAVSVWGVIRAFQWLSSDGPRLTIEVAEGGRIVGDGIRCGAGSSRCSISFAKGDRVELTPEAERDYEFVGFTGACEATRGILLMDGPKTCGARFEKRMTPPTPATYPLTIDKPKGGTIIFELTAITCGTLGSECSEAVPSGKLVKLLNRADDGYVFDRFVGECDGGEFVMNSAKTCGAVFLPTSTPAVSRPSIPRADTGPGTEPRPGARSKPEAKPNGPAPTPPSPSPQAPTGSPTVPPAEPPVAVGTPGPQVQVKPEQPPPPPDTAEEHAKKEIKRRVQEYCDALKTLKPQAVLRVFPNANIQTLKRQFDNYKSLDCTVAQDLEYDRFAIDPGPKASGGAQVRVGIKQTIEWRSGGGPPKSQEMAFTIRFYRTDLNSSWLIDNVEAVPKK